MTSPLNQSTNECTLSFNPIRVGIIGAGGLGRGMAAMLNARQGFQWVAVADHDGFAYDAKGLSLEALTQAKAVKQYPAVGQPSSNSIVELLNQCGESLEALFLAVPNLPVDFYANLAQTIATQTPFQGVMVDALKRTQAMEHLLKLDGVLRSNRILHITGAGATPGFLTTVAAVAAQSFVEVTAVNIHFGVGVANWEQYRATIREDFLHLPGFDADKVAAMSDAEIEAELDKRNGLLELVNMEHADDLILELAGVCPRDRITVGGLVDTRNAKKPVSTTVTVTGRTVSGQTTSHQFVVGDETTMVDNVCGPATGFMAQGITAYQRGLYGVITSADLMPRFTPQTITKPAVSAEPVLATV